MNIYFVVKVFYILLLVLLVGMGFGIVFYLFFVNCM